MLFLSEKHFENQPLPHFQIPPSLIFYLTFLYLIKKRNVMCCYVTQEAGFLRRFYRYLFLSKMNYRLL
jgi:hypothetical protein